MRPVVRGRLDGPSGPTVTEMVDRCRDAVTAAGERGRACPGARTGVRWRRRPAAGTCGPPTTPLAGVVVALGATVTTAHLDDPDLMGRRGGLGTLVITLEQ